MSAWGGGSSSCDALLTRLERNDPTLTICTVLPTKQFGDAQLDRLSSLLVQQSNTHWHTLAASGHTVSASALERFGKALAEVATKAGAQQQQKEACVCPLRSVAVGDANMGDEGVAALCRGLLPVVFSIASKKNSNEGDDYDDHDDVVLLSLTHLDLSYKGLGLSGFAHVAQTLSHPCCRNLKSLDLSRNNFSNKQIVIENATTTDIIPATFIPDSLFAHVEGLDLSSCQIDATLAQSIFGKLFQSKDKVPVRKLNVASNPLGDEGLESMLIHLGHCLNGLYVSNCRLTDTGLERWNDICQSTYCRWPWIQTIDLSNNPALTAHGIKCWSSSPWFSDPTVLPALHEIILVGNRGIGADGVQALVDNVGRRFSFAADDGSVVTSPPQPLTLDLSETDCGAFAAASAVRCSGVKSLRLYNNQLGSDGFDAISEALQTFSSATLSSGCGLHTLDLAGNGASQTSVVNLLQTVLELLSLSADSLALHCLVIGGNEGGENVEHMVHKIQQIRPTLDIARDKFRK